MVIDTKKSAKSLLSRWEQFGAACTELAANCAIGFGVWSKSNSRFVRFRLHRAERAYGISPVPIKVPATTPYESLFSKAGIYAL